MYMVYLDRTDMAIVVGNSVRRPLLMDVRCRASPDCHIQ